jgi:hypothetical protein
VAAPEGGWTWNGTGRPGATLGNDCVGRRRRTPDPFADTRIAWTWFGSLRDSDDALDRPDGVSTNDDSTGQRADISQ